MAICLNWQWVSPGRRTRTENPDGASCVRVLRPGCGLFRQNTRTLRTDLLRRKEGRFILAFMESAQPITKRPRCIANGNTSRVEEDL